MMTPIAASARAVGWVSRLPGRAHLLEVLPVRAPLFAMLGDGRTRALARKQHLVLRIGGSIRPHPLRAMQAAP